jgi:hypothetical protein
MAAGRITDTRCRTLSLSLSLSLSVSLSLSLSLGKELTLEQKGNVGGALLRPDEVGGPAAMGSKGRLSVTYIT